MRQLFSSENAKGILLVDASNAFNSLNHANALANILYLCPPFYTVLTNIYWESSELFLGLSILQSCEGTTRGDPLSMPFYALATRPLMNALRMVTPMVKQVWYADDATAAGKVADLKSRWSKLWTILWVFCQSLKNMVCHKGWLFGPCFRILWRRQRQHHFSWTSFFGFSDWNSGVHLILCGAQSSGVGQRVRQLIHVCR